MNTDARSLVRAGLWDNNAVFGQMLSLCPTMALTTSATNGFGMGMATLAVLTVSNLLVATLRGVITAEVRIPAYVLIIATVVTVVDLSINAWMHELYKVLGLFLPLIVVNCLILGRAESFASKVSVWPALVDGLAMGVGFTLALTVIGAVREVIGSGTLFADASLLFGRAFEVIELTLFSDYPGTLMAILPPGGFLAVGFLLAGKRLIDGRLQSPESAPAAAPACHSV
ncbi:MAG: electron transport complex subunit E [Rhodospirillales bacterium]|nr:electron transport complex subunit E [Rhodospirillales bacterium]